jgi:taurine dehydrogenase large subunit
MYDPFVQRYPGATHGEADSYWRAASGPAPEDDGRVVQDLDADVAIIGGGYTGMVCAAALARDHGIRAVVLEARTSGWGCSGRNGSFARISGGRVALETLFKTYGDAAAKGFFGEMRRGLDIVRRTIADGRIDCDVQPDGVYKVAVSPAHLDSLRREVALYNQKLGYPARYVPAADLAATHGGSEAFGAVHLPDGFSMNPLKLAFGVQCLARASGASVFTNSPVTDWDRVGGRHHLRTPGGTVRARRVVVATNGYTSPHLDPAIAGRVLPVHSQIIVTAPLTDAQVAACLPSSDCMFDTHNLLFYYRRLPDNRILFGGRSAITGREAEHPRHRQYLVDGLTKKFPALAGIGIDYWWGGWVAVTQNALPYVAPVPGVDGAFFGGGCNGSGVSISFNIGEKLAALAAGGAMPEQPSLLERAPARFPFQPFLRVGQRIAYRWLQAKDRRRTRADS